MADTRTRDPARSVRLALAWQVRAGDEEYTLEPLLFDLLQGVREGGHLKHAAQTAGVSYRHAWGLIRGWEARLGEALVTLQRGRGASLTRAGEALLEARDGARSQLARPLAAAGRWASAHLAGVLERDRRRFTIATSHGDRTAALVGALRAADYEVSLDVVGSEGALRRYARGDADAAGFHVPLGVLGASLGGLLLGLLDANRDRLHRLERRRLGLMSRPDAPCDDLDTLVRARRRFVNRQAGSATRLAFDGLLGLAGIAPGDVVGYASEEHTHTAVAAVVAAGGADVGFGTAAAAEAMALRFVALVDEVFYLVSRRDLDASLAAQLDAFCAGCGPHGTPSDPDPFTLSAIRRLHGVSA